MYSYRAAKQPDVEKIREYCLNHGINPPEGIIIFIAEDDEGKIVGVSGLKMAPMIEPVVADSPFVTQILAEKTLAFATAVLSPTGGKVTALVHGERDSWISLLEKYGFVITDKNMTILKKEV